MKKGGKALGEALNFKVYDGRCYGYAPRGAINLQRLGASPGAKFIDRVLIVWTATDPAQGGRYIVGWYRNSRVYSAQRNDRPDKNRPEMLVEATAADCHVVPVDERTFYLPSRIPGWPGIASTFFASQTLSPPDLKTVLDYINGIPSSGFLPPSDSEVPPITSGWPTQDPELRAKVEKAAINATILYYRKFGWFVTSVENENYGWDLEARKSGRLLRIEVKGRGALGGVEITPNEYTAMQAKLTRMSYRLAIVHDSLTPSPKVSVFEYVPASDSWIGPSNVRLLVAPKTGAVASF